MWIWTSKKHIKFWTATIVLIAVFFLGVMIYMTQGAQAATENCEQYDRKAQEEINKLEKELQKYPELRADWILRYTQKSIAYSLLYQNCLARNKR